jgi:hypothetical protein
MSEDKLGLPKRENSAIDAPAASLSKARRSSRRPTRPILAEIAELTKCQLFPIALPVSGIRHPA